MAILMINSKSVNPLCIAFPALFWALYRKMIVKAIAQGLPNGLNSSRISKNFKRTLALIISALKEEGSETRVAITPATVKHYLDLGLEVLIEKDAGLEAGFV